MLKLYAWEPSFEKQVMKIRNREVKVLRQAAYINAGFTFIWTCAPFLVKYFDSICIRILFPVTKRFNDDFS